MVNDKKECKYWTNWYCMKYDKFVLTKESKTGCVKCKEFIDRKEKEN